MARSWLSNVMNWISDNTKTKINRRGRKKARSYHPMVEQLEERQVPTTISIPTNLAATQGSVVTVPVNVDTLADPTNGNYGFSGADIVIYYDPSVFTVSSGDVSRGSAIPGTGASAYTGTPGLLIIEIYDTISTATAGGSLANINFHVKSTAPMGPSYIDLAADEGGGPPGTDLTDDNFNNYTLATAPVDNATLSPSYSYSGSDPCDGMVDIAVQMSIPRNLSAGLSTVVTVPVNISSLNDTYNSQSGFTGADIVIYYDPSVFTVSSGDVTAGSAVSGEGVSVGTGTDGLLTIGVYGSIRTSTAGGSLVNINFHVQSTAPLGPSYIDLAADEGGGPPGTDIADQNFNNYTLNYAPQDNTVLSPSYSYTGYDPCDGVVTIRGAATHFAIVAPAFVTTGTAFSATVTALDSNGDVAWNYTGTVQFTSTDSGATLPANTTLTNDTGVFSVTFSPSGNYTLTVTDTVTSSITATTSNINVS